MIDDEPPSVHADEIVFGDDFHDTMHSVFRCRANGYPRGSWRLHLEYKWHFKWEPELHRVTLCRVGRHRVGKGWRRDADEQNRGVGPWRIVYSCHDCAYEPPLEKL